MGLRRDHSSSPDFLTHRLSGKFGDGLQSACSVFVRNNQNFYGDSNMNRYSFEQPAENDVCIRSMGYRYHFRYQHKQNCPNIQSLHYQLIKEEGPDIPPDEHPVDKVRTSVSEL